MASCFARWWRGGFEEEDDGLGVVGLLGGWSTATTLLVLDWPRGKKLLTTGKIGAELSSCEPLNDKMIRVFYSWDFF
jgi:hypothetical protein